MRRVILLIALLLTAPVSAQETLPQSREQIALTFAPLVREVAPAVVNIYTASPAMAGSPFFDDPVLRELFGDSFGPGFDQERMQSALGSGVLVSSNGLIITNHHVIAGAEEITVILSDQREFPATLVLDDERTDLAVLRVDPEGESLPFLELGDSDQLAVGDLVLAVGNPFGVGQTVTMGIVSALARTQVGVSDYSFFIQTDAAINPGNSGGALVSLDGRLMGVNTAIFSRSGGSIGIGFAIPATMVRSVIHSAETGQPIVRPWPGFVAESVTAELAKVLGRDKPGGVVVSQIFPEGPAAKAGLEPGDLILAVDGQPLQDRAALLFRLATRGVGEEARLSVERDGQSFDVLLPLEGAPEMPTRDLLLLEGRQPLAGAQVVNLSPSLSEELGLQDQWQGVMILSVQRGTPARRLRFRPGDIIHAVNDIPITSTQHLAKLLAEPAPDGWVLAVERDGVLDSLAIRP